MTREPGYLVTEYSFVTVEPVVLVTPPAPPEVQNPGVAWGFFVLAIYVAVAVFAIGYGAWFCWTFYPNFSLGCIAAVAAITAGIFYKKRQARANKRDVVT